MKRCLLGVLIAVTAFKENAFACSCAPPARPGMTEAEILQIRLKTATSVFVGTVRVSHRKTSPLAIVLGPLWAAMFGEGTFEHIATFQVQTDVKNAGRREIRVRTGQFGGGLCGFMFEGGKSYLVYPYGERELETNICSRTREFDEIARQQLKLLLP